MTKPRYNPTATHNQATARGATHTTCRLCGTETLTGPDTDKAAALTLTVDLRTWIAPDQRRHYALWPTPRGVGDLTWCWDVPNNATPGDCTIHPQHQCPQ